MKIDYQRLRNLTTQRLHTDIAAIYEDLEAITGQSGIMTHMIPRVMRAVEPWLRAAVPEERFWDGSFDQTHIGVYDLPEPNHHERELMLKLYCSQPDPLAGRDVVVIQVEE